VVAAQEEERRRLSRELHDEAGQALTGLKISLELIQADLPAHSAVLRWRLGQAITLADTMMDQMRVLAQDLRPPALDAVGLNLTLEGFCRSFAGRTRLAIDYAGTDLPPLSDTVTIALYRVLQEALTNVAKHAEASHVQVTLRYDAETVCLSIVDNGRGFDRQVVFAGAHPAMGIGLVGMQERLQLSGGRLEIDSRLEHGTRLVAYVPWQEGA
jgi:signal transduction histidine kinase